MYTVLKRTCKAIFLLIKPFVSPRSRCRRRPGVLKGATSRYFESFSSPCKITFNVKETTKY